MTPANLYYYRAYAENALGVSYGSTVFSFTTLSTGGVPTVTDIDNNAYSTVMIGSALWMRENLKTTRLNDGTAIENVQSDDAWKGLTTPAYSW